MEVDPNLQQAWRGYRSSNRSRFHSDHLDGLALACVRPAGEGGESCAISAAAIHNVLAAERPDLLPVLYAGFRMAWFGEPPSPGEKVTDLDVPVFSWSDGRIVCVMLPDETFNPTRMTSGTDIARSFQVYNRLTALDRNINVVPNLATQWESANEAREWTFELREGVEFHNGKTMTSEDVLYSFEIHMKEGSESPSKPYLSAVTDVEADGPNVVKFTLNSGNADFPVVLGYDYHMGIVPAGWTDADPITGTGRTS